MYNSQTIQIMKKILLLTGLILITFFLSFSKMNDCSDYSKNIRESAILLGKEDIPVYAEPFDELRIEKPIDVIHQVEDTDTFFYATIIECSPLRFKIEYIPAWIPVEEEEKYKKIGWVDKMNIGLYAFESRSFRLYEQADRDSLYKDIFVESVHDYSPVGVRNLTFVLLDVDGEFRKVMFVSDGKTYIGWIDLYCDDVYGCYGS